MGDHSGIFFYPTLLLMIDSNNLPFACVSDIFLGVCFLKFLPINPSFAADDNFKFCRFFKNNK